MKQNLVKTFKWTVKIALAVTFGLVALTFLKSDWTKIQKIELVQSAGSSQILFERIQNSLADDIKKAEGRRVWEVSLKELRNLVQKDRRVKNVAIHREFPSAVKVEIETYSPVLAFLDSDGKMYPVATDATLLPAVSSQEGFDVPILRGEGVRENIEVREAAIQLLSHAPESGGISRKSISEIVYDKNNGFKVFLAGANTEVRLGDTDFGLKVSRVAKVLSYLENQNIKSRVIDASFSKKVVVRARNAP